MSDSSSSNESLDVQEPPATLSAETTLAVRQYNQQVASYTLRQWNVAKLESERKERDRRKRRADYLQQQKQQQSANAVPAVRPLGPLNSTGSHGTRPPSEAIRPNGDGPLMMVSKRRTDRALSGGSSVPCAGPAQSATRHSHDQRYASHQSQSHDIHADIASVADQRQQQLPAAQQQRPRRHQRSSHADHSALHPISPIPAASSIVVERPRAKHMGSGVTGLTTSAVVDDEDDEQRPLTPPLNRAWQRHSSGWTPPITIPKQSVTTIPTVTGSASSGCSSSASRSAPGARALGFAAHLGMTSISNGPSTSALIDAMSAGTSTSDPTSEGSSRMSSFSEHNGMPGVRNSLKKVTEEHNYPRSIDDHGRSMRPHRMSLGATISQRAPAKPCAVEGAIGTLRRMTISGDEAGVFGALDPH